MVLVHHVRSRVRDCKVKKPVACGRHGQAFGAYLEREKLARDYPRHWSPGAGEEKDVYADESDCCSLSGKVGESGRGAGDGDDELANTHANLC